MRPCLFSATSLPSLVAALIGELILMLSLFFRGSKIQEPTGMMSV